MRKLNVQELRKIQLDILCCVADFCDKHEIRYFLDYGTLLGAVRHKGYIPWDDDIDIGMLREDYDRFAKLFNQYNDKYRFICIENSPEFYLPFGKVYDPATELHEFGNSLAVNIDIFVHDNAPDDDRIVKKMYNTAARYKHIYEVKKTRVKFEGNLLKWAVKIVRKVLYTMLYHEPLQKISALSQTYAHAQTDRFGDFNSIEGLVCHKRVLDHLVDVEFEGVKFKAPCGYDEYLRTVYGDYMQLPPEEKRVAHHGVEAFIKDEQ